MKRRYLKMLEGMSRKPAEPQDCGWSVYILRCADGTFYTGITNNLEARLKRHNEGKGAAYTRTRTPVEVLHHETGFMRSQALIREAQIKRLSRAGKQALIMQDDERPAQSMPAAEIL